MNLNKLVERYEIAERIFTENIESIELDQNDTFENEVEPLNGNDRFEEIRSSNNSNEKPSHYPDWV